MVSPKNFLEDSEQGRKLRNSMKTTFRLGAAAIAVGCWGVLIFVGAPNPDTGAIDPAFSPRGVLLALFPIFYWFCFLRLLIKGLDESVGKDRWKTTIYKRKTPQE